MKIFLNEIKQAGNLWYDKDADHIAAAVSYYSVFGLVPFILLTYVLTGWFLGREVIVRKMTEWGSILESDVIGALAEAINNLESLSSNFTVPTFGVVFFSGMVIVMINTFSSGLMKIWGVEHKGFGGWLEKSGRSILYVVFLQLVIIFSIFSEYFIGKLEVITSPVIVWPVWFLLNYFTMAIVMLISYKGLTWKSPTWVSCWRGALIVSALFLILKIFIKIYVSITPFPGLFGAAGILIGLLIWVYATISLVYFGAAFSYVADKRVSSSELK